MTFYNEVWGERGQQFEVHLKVVHYQINHLIVVCDINVNSF